MKIRQILTQTAHRPWELPKGDWKFYQEWNDAIFLHYKVDEAELRKHVPEELEIDSFNGDAWVSVVPFTMEKLRPRNLPYFPPISDFHEINIRTYVRSGHKSGVYFLSIEGGNRISCKLAKKISELPYRFTSITRTDGKYESYNEVYGDSLKLQFEVNKSHVPKSDFDNWLTERYALFQDSGESINAFDIHHLAWKIQDIKMIRLEINYPRFNNLIHNKPDVVQYSKGVQVIAWEKMKSTRKTLE